MDGRYKKFVPNSVEKMVANNAATWKARM